MNEAPVTLDDLGLDSDPGCDWHPRAEKSEAYDVEGNLRDLSDSEVLEHEMKPEADTQPDSNSSLAAEDSEESPEGEV